MRILSLLILLLAVPASWDFDEATIGELPTGWTAAKVKVTAFRARQKLRKQLGGLL